MKRVMFRRIEGAFAVNHDTDTNAGTAMLGALILAMLAVAACLGLAVAVHYLRNGG